MNREIKIKIKKYLPDFIIGIIFYFLSLRQIAKWPKFWNDYYEFCKKNQTKSRFVISLKNLSPMLGEDTASTGFDRHYIYHPAWAIRKILENQPKFHVDISSALTFVSMLSAMIPVQYYDYRPAKLKLPGLFCGQADLTKLPFNDNEIESLSCMHVVEHVGLGRYGDPVNPDGDLLAINELKRVLAINGDLLINPNKTICDEKDYGCGCFWFIKNK